MSYVLENYKLLQKHVSLLYHFVYNNWNTFRWKHFHVCHGMCNVDVNKRCFLAQRNELLYIFVQVGINVIIIFLQSCKASKYDNLCLWTIFSVTEQVQFYTKHSSIIIDNEDKQNNSCNIFILWFGDCGHDLHNTQIRIYIYIMIL